MTIPKAITITKVHQNEIENKTQRNHIDTLDCIVKIYYYTFRTKKKHQVENK